MGYYQRRSVKPRLENLYQAHRGVECSIGVMAGNVLDAEILSVAYHGTAEILINVASLQLATIL